MAIQRRLTAALGLSRLQSKTRLPIELRFKAIGIGGSRLARRVGKLSRKVRNITVGQQRINY